ncbi:MAG: sodium:proton antiporter [Verrucomicrobia bacterium]|nr:sodium:proton antiporter [Verrucomicrobiota bacterium]
MEIYTLAAVILGISALASVFNARILRLPETIGLMATGLLASAAFLLVGLAFPSLVMSVCHRVAAFDFSVFVLDFALGFLIFAGAFTADSESMQRDRWPILIFATLGILLSTFIAGGLAFGILQLVGMTSVPFIHCLLFGALISPTDPIAVLAILKGTAVPRSLQADIAGESLLNDGVAVVVFITILQMAGGGGEHGGAESHGGVLPVLTLFAREVLGGALLGAVFGWIGTKLVRTARVPAVDILISLAMVMGCYAVAWKLHVSGPLALVVTGLMFGIALRKPATGISECEYLDSFWEGIDHILNAVLFTLMGMVLLGLSENFELRFLAAGLLAIPAVLLARLTSVSLSLPLTKLRSGKPGTTITMLTWGGLRGGISIALALSLSGELSRDLILIMTYVVVAFSILVQGMTISPLVKKLITNNDSVQ